MPTLRGERFHIPLNDSDLESEQTVENETPGFMAAGVLGDVLERDSIAPTAPVAPVAPTVRTVNGWPSHKKRYVKKQEMKSKSASQTPTQTVPNQSESTLERDRRDIDNENTKRIDSMSTEEIEQERQELLATFDQDLLRSFMNRRKPTHESKAVRGSVRSRPSVSERKVSFAVPEDDDDEHNIRRQSSAQSHAVPSPSSPRDLLPPKSHPSRPNVINTSGRKVSFSVPDLSDIQDEQSAASHSIPSTSPTTTENNAASPSLQNSRRPSQSGRKVSFSLPDASNPSRRSPSASSHSIPTAMSIADETKPLIPPRRLSSSEDRKVPSSIPFAEQESDNASAASHSMSASEVNNDISIALNASSPRRPYYNDRKVSFATPFDDDDDDDDARSTASHHSVPPTPQFKSEPIVGISDEDVHFPRPDQPELDPESETFLEDLHQKYFPNLAHDPAKLDWMKPVDPRESSVYDPSMSDDIHPKDIRFNFQGKIIPPSKSASLPTNLGLHNHAAAPDAAGYTIAELAHLARSSYAPQRCIAIQTLGRVLFRLGSGEYGKEEHILRKDAAGQKALLAKGLWAEVEQGHAVETISEEANKERGHQTSIAIAQEALWNWQRGGGSARARPAQ